MARAPGALIRRPRSYAELSAEGALLAGGGRALLLQLAHPSVARGVAEHSRFAEDPLKRLWGTLEYLYVLAFGSEEETRLVARYVGGAHRGVRGDGYDARDPDLQLWVAATLYDTTVQVAEAVHGPLPDALADELYREDARIGTALGMPAELWPADRAAFAVYWREQLALLEVTPVARGLATALLRPESGPLWMRALMPLARLLTAGLLPEPIRSGYGVRWTPELERRFTRTFRAVLAVYRVLPGPVRRAPSHLLLRRFRARTGGAAAGRVGRRT
ncbi:oxygenase MpaB family protein [Naasia sp. SYSU D00057]|uniref:oxygenase MpaB family protein n=1 Tax=Naasia sp. SYSU D00057 TaxID=2817380 RepID=UPI001B300B20|nr:oxygenase MpaB family protein [Naasia sp. SYSU D00057]